LATVPGEPEIELTWNWSGEDASRMAPSRNFGHLAFAVDDIYATCAAFQARGTTILRPPTDGAPAMWFGGGQLSTSCGSRRECQGDAGWLVGLGVDTVPFGPCRTRGRASLPTPGLIPPERSPSAVPYLEARVASGFSRLRTRPEVEFLRFFRYSSG
jgi:catechol 2,3-dioxygenase-like lactoylglutathione lyase family enzyme